MGQKAPQWAKERTDGGDDVLLVTLWLRANQTKCNKYGGVGLGVLVSPFNNTNPKWYQTMWTVIHHHNKFLNYEKMTEVTKDDSRHLAGA